MASRELFAVICFLLFTASSVLADDPPARVNISLSNCSAELTYIRKPLITLPAQVSLYYLPSQNTTATTSIPGNWIGLIDCDDADSIVESAKTANAIAVVIRDPSCTISNTNIGISVFTANSTCLKSINSITPLDATLISIGNSGSGINGYDPNGKNSNSSQTTSMQTYATAMIVLYAVSGVVLGLFFIVVVTNIVRNRLRVSSPPIPSMEPNNRNQRRGIARAALDSFPVYLFSLRGVNTNTPGPEEPNKNPKDDLEKAKIEETNESSIEMEAIPTTDTVLKSILTDEPEPITPIDGIANQLPDNLPEKLPDAIVNQIRNSRAYSRSTSIISSHRVTEEQLTCPICLGDFESGEELRILPCHHQYHTSCIDPWLLDISPLCPMCKADYTSWNLDVLTNQSEDSYRLSDISSANAAPDDAVNDDDSLSQASSNSPQVFPHFRWIKYLRTIRLGRRRRRSRRPTVRHSILPVVTQTTSYAVPLETAAQPNEVREIRDLRTYRASM